RSGDGVRGRVRLALAEGRFAVAVGLITAVGMTIVLYLGIAHVRSGALSLGELLLVMGYVAKLYDPMKTISRKVATLQGYLVSVERAFAVLDEQPDVEERPDAQPIARSRGTIAFENVSFSYAPYPARAASRSSQPPGQPMCTKSSSASRRVTTRRWGSGASSCRGASVNASPWRAPS